MDRNEIARNDFPRAAEGYDPASVDAHLAAVAAWIAALEARIDALGIERAAIESRQAGAGEDRPAPAVPVEIQGSVSPGRSERSDDEGAARLVASERLLAGRPADEVIAQIGAEFDLDDPDSLVQEVSSKLA